MPAVISAPLSSTRRRYADYPLPIDLHVKLASGTVYHVNVSDLTIEGGALLLWGVDLDTLEGRLLTAFAPGQWLQVEPARTGVDDPDSSFEDCIFNEWDESPALPINDHLQRAETAAPADAPCSA